MSLFDSILYDKTSQEIAADCKAAFENVEDILLEYFSKNTRQLDIVLERLEEAHLWVGKLIKAEQIVRNVNYTPKDEV